MEKGLEQVGALPGVGGSFLCDNKGDVIVSSDPAVLATVTMNTIGREVGRVFVALETARQPADRIDFVYNSWRLLPQDMGHPLLFFVCQPGAGMASVRVTVDVVVARGGKDVNAQKRLQRHQAERAALVSRAVLDQGSWSSWTVLTSGGQPSMG